MLEEIRVTFIDSYEVSEDKEPLGGEKWFSVCKWLRRLSNERNFKEHAIQLKVAIDRLARLMRAMDS